MYSVKPVVCDYGVYQNNNLIVICNSSRNAQLIKAILEKDYLCNSADYTFDFDDMDKFMAKWCSDIEMRSI